MTTRPPEPGEAGSPAATPVPPAAQATAPASAPDARSEFELRTQALLEESTSRLDGRIRSRLNQARHAALDAHAARAGSPLGRWFGNRSRFAPAGAVAAVAVLAVVLWTGRPGGEAPLGAMNGDGAAALEDLDLLADNDALELASGADVEFYEWALAESDLAAGAGPVGT
jgi:hypothetical protein